MGGHIRCQESQHRSSKDPGLSETYGKKERMGCDKKITVKRIIS